MSVCSLEMATLLNKVEDIHIGIGLSKSLEGYVRKDSSHMKIKRVGFEGLTRRRVKAMRKQIHRRKTCRKCDMAVTGICISIQASVCD